MPTTYRARAEEPMYDPEKERQESAREPEPTDPATRRPRLRHPAALRDPWARLILGAGDTAEAAEWFCLGLVAYGR